MTIRGKPRWQVVPILAVAGLFVSGCAKVPNDEIEAANAAMGNAMQAGAEEYALEAVGSMRDLRAELDTELAVQSEKWAMTRSYDRARELAFQVTTAAEAAGADAAAAKEAVRQETSVLLEEVKVALQEVQTMLASAPTGKGTAADLAALGADLDSAVVTLGEGEAAFAEGRYLEAKTKVLAVQAGAQSVRTAIEAALQARNTRRGMES